MREYNELVNLVGKAAKALNDNEKFAIPILAVKASKAAQENPHDAPLVTMSNVLNKMASSNNLFISRTELNKLYDQLYVPNTKIAEVFADELARVELQGPKLFQRDPHEATEISDDYSRVADPVLANALSSVFDKNAEYKPYSTKLAQAAEKACMHELNGLGVPPKKVDIFAGKDDILICNASYDTPKGQTNVLVPVEIAEGDKPLLPTMFLSTAGFVDLSRETLETHIESTAGKSYKVNGEELLKVLSTAKHGLQKVASDVDMAMIRMRAETGTPAVFAQNNIVYQKIDDEPEETVVVKSDLSLDRKLASVNGQVEYLFGENVVSAGRAMLQRKFASMGYNKAQVSVADSKGTDTIFYAVALDRNSAVKVPVKVEDGMVIPPTVVIASGKVGEFSPAGIVSVLDGGTDSRMLAVANPMFGETAGQLLEKVKIAIHEGNTLAVEDAINVLSETDPVAYKTAVALFMESLSGKEMEKIATAKGCSRIVKTSTHTHPICGHLNLPLNKVYQDENGDCQPLHRKAMQDVGTGAYFMAHKVLL